MRPREEVLARLRPSWAAGRPHLATVSGILTTRPALVRWVDLCVPEVDMITTKSYQVRPNPGYREPVVVEAEVGCFGNAVGLRNPGMDEGFRELQELRRSHELRALLCVSLSASSAEEFALLARRFGPVADLLELNLSCPHAQAGYGAAIGQDPRRVAAYLRAIRLATPRPLVAKLTPNVEAIGPIARAAVAAGADAISAVNTVGPEVFREPGSGDPILGNPNGGKGGKSGDWIREVARAKVAEIREAVGLRVPIIGMGGVSTARDVLALRAAGADLVGLGSVLARVPRQELIPLFAAALSADCRLGSNTAADFLSPKRLMQYRPFRLAGVRELGPELRLLTLEGRLEAQPGQYAFLYIPGVGEKPFSIASGSPPTFVVRRRGIFTSALFGLCPGQRLLVRGPYGAAAPESSLSAAVVIAGGTGIAVAAPLVKALRKRHGSVRFYFGVGRAEELALSEALCPGMECRAVADQGVPARVLETLPRELAPGGAEGRAFYLVGPEGFLRKAAAVAEALGAAPREIYACLETPSLCGVGLCGSCECGGRLLCKEGTFVSVEALRAAGAGFESEAADSRHAEAERFVPAGSAISR
ncbi:MAG: dihydroorotate dehydrogenase [Spirochaetales bacterium]|nr:dihydroorotate dehydrogenase [Spirochaetales bacterium]